MSRMGANHEHEERQRATHMETSCCVSPCYFLVKDHKKYDSSTGAPPPVRPVCSSVSGMNVHLSNIISTYLEVIADEMEGTMETISTEDALHRIDKLNSALRDRGGGNNSFNSDKLLEEGEHDLNVTDEEEFMSDEEMTESSPRQSNNLIVMGADVCSMYPSLDAVASSKLVYKAVMESNVKFKGLNIKEVVTYLAIKLNITEARMAKISHLLPTRKHK